MIMRPQWYCDALPLIVGGDTGASGPVLRNRMLSLLHGIFTQRPGAFAVAFPGREQLAVLPPPLTGALRVFASSREDMDWLAENVDGFIPTIDQLIDAARPVVLLQGVDSPET